MKIEKSGNFSLQKVTESAPFKDYIDDSFLWMTNWCLIFCWAKIVYFLKDTLITCDQLIIVVNRKDFTMYMIPFGVKYCTFILLFLVWRGT